MNLKHLTGFSRGAKTLQAALLAAVLAVLCVPQPAHAQGQKATPAPPAAGTSSGSFITPETSSSQDLPAAEQEDETAVYKKSSSVRAIGRMLGLSPEASSAVFEYFNFLLLAGIVIFYLAKALPKAFRERQKKIDQQLVEARAATQEANERLQAVEERLGRLDRQIGEIRTQAEQDSAAEEERIKRSIEEERRKVVAAAEQEIAVASASAQASLRRFAAELAMDRAAGRLHLTEQQDRALVHDFAAGLDKGGRPGLSKAELKERRN